MQQEQPCQQCRMLQGLVGSGTGHLLGPPGLSGGSLHTKGGGSPSSGSGPASVSCSVGKPEDLNHSTGTWTQLLKNTRRALARVSPHTLGRAWRGVLGSAWHQDGACAPALLLPQCRAFPRLLFLHFQPAHAVIIIIILIIKLQGVV